jgi:hypothetical protein
VLLMRAQGGTEETAPPPGFWSLSLDQTASLRSRNQ